MKGRRAVKKGYKKRGMRKARMYRSVADKASCSITRTLTPINANAVVTLAPINLADYTRAVAIAQNYQRFRITGVKFTIKPVLDTYAITAAGVVYGKPNFYYIVDKTASLPTNCTLEALKQSGARVKVLDEKPFSVKWKPSVLEENQSGGGLGFAGPAGYQTSPWLSTNQQANNPGLWAPNITNHLGLKFYVDQLGNGTTAVATPFPIEVTVDFEFIKPMIGNLVTPGEGQVTTYAKIDASPDGVEGGNDGITIPLQALTV